MSVSSTPAPSNPLYVQPEHEFYRRERAIDLAMRHAELQEGYLTPDDIVNAANTFHEFLTQVPVDVSGFRTPDGVV